MAYNRFYLTDKGRRLLGKVESGQILKFSNVAIGKGEIGSTEQMLNMVGLMDEVKRYQISGCVYNDDGTATVKAVITNKELTTGFFVKEIGVFAIDPDEGEVLFAVASNNEYPDFIPPRKQLHYEMVLEVILAVGNARDVKIIIDESLVFATRAELLDLAGVGRTDETVKKNADDITRIWLAIMALQSSGTSNIQSNQFKVTFESLSEDEDYEGIYEQAKSRLAV